MLLVFIVATLLIAGVVVIFRLWQVRSGSKNEKSQQHSHYDYHNGGEFPVLPASPIYTIPHSMAHIGDKSDDYAELRKTFDSKLRYDPERSLEFQRSLRKYDSLNLLTFDGELDYDVYNCPDTPPHNYPHEWKTLDILSHWSPEDIQVPSRIHQGLCVFDYRKDNVKALRYRNAELPFVVTGDPQVAEVVERWNSPNYLEELLGWKIGHRAEISFSNHFMYWVPPDIHHQRARQAEQEEEEKDEEEDPSLNRHQRRQRRRRNNPPDPILPEGWTAPTQMIRMTYPEFRSRAMRNVSNDEMHWYFRLIGCGETGPKGECDAGSSEWLFDELVFFQPRPNLLYLKEPSKQRGIHCRFGMQGVTIANHFDSSRNAVVVLGGERRYILSHPKHCSNMALYPKSHPSGRHSAVDWSNPDLETFPEFANAYSNEVVLQAGDVLYLPTNWFHYIVSLGFNYQCNTRSGTSEEYMPPIEECGFKME